LLGRKVHYFGVFRVVFARLLTQEGKKTSDDTIIAAYMLITQFDILEVELSSVKARASLG